jgi:transposase-like protein
MPCRRAVRIRRIELITGERRRRQWTAEETAPIVAESFEEGANISRSRRNGVVGGLLTVWRHKFAAAAGVQAPGFVPVRIACEGGPVTVGEPDCEGAAATNRERYGLDGAGDPRRGVEGCLVSAAISAGADSGQSGSSSQPRDTSWLGEACRLVAQVPLRAATADDPGLTAAVLR